jgi:aconitate hydratase
VGETLTHKLIRSHLEEGAAHAGEEIAIRMDQALLQDATGTLAWLEFEQMGPKGVDPSGDPVRGPQHPPDRI